VILASAYQAAFFAESWRPYPMIDHVETETGFTLSRERLQTAARVLACPVKAHPPNWQHGRVLYAVASRALRGFAADVTSIGPWGPASAPVTLLDIGTAKGFSALCLQWALLDSGVPGRVVSVDVIDPAARVLRNTVAECDGPKTLAELLAPWPEAHAITFVRQTGADWLASSLDRVHVAFVDGKHTGDVVRAEGHALARRQRADDVVVFDDLQIPGVASAVSSLASMYAVETIDTQANRIYAVGRRR
jgi:predicted O-methyltransferase YrrM